jgi:D-aminopeptidase
MANGSGDFVVAFSTANRRPHAPAAPLLQLAELHDEATSPLFLAAVEATEEAIYNSLLKATTVTGHQGHRVEAIPLERLREILARHGRTP